MIASAFLNRSMPATRRVPGFRPAVMPFLGTVWMVCLPLAVSPLPAQPAVAVRRGTVEWSVGGGTADERITVTRVVGLAVSAAGQLFVADGDNAHIVVYPPGGGAPTVIGRAGGGPGEFRRLGVLAVHRQQLLVRDEGSMRLHRFALAGAKATYAGSVPLPELLAGAGRPLFLLADGSSYEEGLVVHHRDGALRPSRLHRGANGKILREDTLVVPPGADEGVQKTRIPQRDATGAVVGVSERTLLLPFGARWLRAYGPDGLRADVVTSRYEVRIYDRQERLLTTVRRTPPRVGISWREATAKREQWGGLQAGTFPSLPSTKPPVQALAWSRDGHLWVERAVADGRLREADVFDQRGTLVGQVAWPAALDLLNGLPWIDRWTVWAVQRSEEADDQVVRVRFAATPPG
jgi:hypothetical protein